MPEGSGKFITFEGPEGSGKTTQIALLAEFLRQKGLTVITTREPGGEKVAEKIRRLLLSPSSTLEPLSELFLYAASRIQHVEKIIRPALQKRAMVLCDRFSDATMAYQGYGRGISKRWIREINKIATTRLKPDLTILLDLEPGLGLKRVRRFKKGSAQVDRLERETLSFHQRVRQGYLELARESPRRIKVVRVSGVKETQAKIREIVARVI
jgi:dTMP kinase